MLKFGFCGSKNPDDHSGLATFEFGDNKVCVRLDSFEDFAKLKEFMRASTGSAEQTAARRVSQATLDFINQMHS